MMYVFDIISMFPVLRYQYLSRGQEVLRFLKNCNASVYLHFTKYIFQISVK